MFYKIAVLVASLAIAFIVFSSKVQKTYAYRSRNYYSYYGYYGYTYYGTSMAWYIWVVISGAIFGTIVAVIACCFCCRRRRMNAQGTVISYNNGVTTVAGTNPQGPYVTGAQPVGTPYYAPPPGTQQPYPQQPYPQQPYPQQPYPQQPYPTAEPYPAQPGAEQPYPSGKMPEPPAYVSTTAPPYPSDAPAPPAYGQTNTSNGYTNQAADVKDNL